MELGISGGIGLLFGCLLAWLALRSRTAALQARLSLTEKELAAVKADLARVLADQRQLVESRARLESALESERKTSNEKIELLMKSGERAAADLQNAFKALAADALKNNNSSFLQIAQETSEAVSERGKGRSRRTPESGRGSGHAGAGISEQGGCANSADGNCARRGLWRPEGAGTVSDQHAARIAIRDGKPGEGLTHAECPRTVGGDPATARGGDCGDASLL